VLTGPKWSLHRQFASKAFLSPTLLRVIDAASERIKPVMQAFKAAAISGLVRVL
jgi:hypothetical protein